MTYRIDLVEMQAHAAKLNNVGQQVNHALSAAQVVSNMEAFGKLGFRSRLSAPPRRTLRWTPCARLRTPRATTSGGSTGGARTSRSTSRRSPTSSTGCTTDDHDGTGARARRELPREHRRGDADPGGRRDFHDATETVKGFSSGNWAEGLITAGATVAGVAGVLADPLAALFSAGFGWLVEHVWFLKEPLDWLVGDQEALDGMAKTWENVSSYLKDTSDDLRNWVKNDTTGWTGKDSDQCRLFGADRADTYAGVATAAGGIASLVRTCKIVLKVVRDIVRDLISEAIGKLISICLWWAPAVAAAGAGLAGAIAECIPVAVKWANKALEACRRLTKAFSNAGGLFKKLDDILVNAKTALSKSGDDFVTVLKKGIDADIRRSMADFSVTDMAKDALGEAKKVAVDGFKSARVGVLPRLGIEATKESTKSHDWEDKAKDGGGWRTWRDLRAEEAEKQEEKRKEANGG